MLLDVLLPKQLQRDVLVGLELFVNDGEVRLGLLVASRHPLPAEQQLLQLSVVTISRQRPLDAGRLGPFQVVVNAALADRATARDLALSQAQLM